MPIDVLTGQPGNGKTTKMMERLVNESKKTPEQGRRFLVAIGIEGLQPGLVDLELSDGREWNLVNFNLDGCCLCHDGTFQCLDKEGLPRKVRAMVPGSEKPQLVDNPEWQKQVEVGRPHSHIVPDGSLIFVDEGWKWFGHLQDARQAPTPAHVLALAEHRHRGLDFIMTTQMANQLFPFMRGLVGEHTHIVRQFGTSLCKLYTWPELNDDVKSQTQRDRALSTPWTLPSNIFANWKSASVHTIKRKIPWRIVLIPICFIVAISLVVWVYSSMRKGKLTGAPQPQSGEAAAASESGEHGAAKEKPLTAEEWAAQFTPRFKGVHGSEPAFDGRKVVSKPATYCIMSGAQTPQECHCYTEQVTPIQEVTPDACRTLARNGVYDYFREPFKGVPAQRTSTAKVEPTKESAKLSESFDEPRPLIPGAVEWSPLSGPEGPR